LNDAHEPTPAEATAPSAAGGLPTEIEFMSLFLGEQRRIYRFIRSLIPNAQDAEDVLQETAVVLWREFSDFQVGTNFFAWACKVAHFKVLKHRQRRGRDATLLNDDVLEQLVALALTNDVGFDPRRAALEQCMGRLSVRDRAIIEQRYSGQATGKAVAAKLGRPANSVYKSLGRIRRMLLECIRREVAATERNGGSQ
jgi:RNA polymerase sigma-70 factor (ECF subfamily)